MGRHTFVLHNRWALGDTVCLSALVRDIQKAHPGKYRVLMSGHYKNVAWHNNPHCEVAADDARGQLVKVEYHSGIKACNNGLKKHFLSWFHFSFHELTGLAVPVTEPKGDIYLTPDERKNRPDGRYWVIVAGGKMDMTAKVWSALYWQQTVDMLAKHGIRCVQAGGDFNRHFHPRLSRVEQYVGKTRSERDFFSLIAGAEGVVCGITAAMHLAAAFDKPCVVIAGGREAPWWEAYTNAYQPMAFGAKCPPVKIEHAFLHTVGLLDCGLGNTDRGCWRDRAVPIEQADYVNPKNKAKLCRKVVEVGHQMVPKCLQMISPDHVVEAVMNYYEKGVLPPIGQPKKTYSLPVVAGTAAEDSIPQPDGTHQVTVRVPQLSELGPAPKLAGFDPAAPGVSRGVITKHEFDHSTEPPTEKMQIVWDTNWAKQMPKPVEPQQGETTDFAALDHPYVGGKFTLFVLGYGDNWQLMERCLGSILDTCPRHRFDLRVALNQPSPRLLDYVQAFDKKTITKVYVDRGTRKKYPAMREMFWDEAHPIETPYICWFDDDSWCRKRDWMPLLAQSIRANHPQQGRLYGARMYHDLMGVKRAGALREKWFQAATWWKGRHLFSAGGMRLSPNGSQIVFASGGFWALATHVIREADIPDIRLNHNGGDCTIGCQVTQAGYKVVDFSPRPGKDIIAWSDAPRRGYREAFPWA